MTKEEEKEFRDIIRIWCNDETTEFQDKLLAWISSKKEEWQVEAYKKGWHKALEFKKL